MKVRLTRVVLDSHAATHLDSNPANTHLAQRWLTYRRRRAIGDLFLGPYDLQALPLALFALAARFIPDPFTPDGAQLAPAFRRGVVPVS